MAKKGKKSPGRKSSAKKKATRKSAAKTSRMSVAKRRARKPARKAPARKRAPARKPMPRKTAAASKHYTVDSRNCVIDPRSHHVESKVQHGSVVFDANASCAIEFSEPNVLDVPSNPLALLPGPNGPYYVKVDYGETKFWITNCSRGTPSDPSDIIVP